MQKNVGLVIFITMMLFAQTLFAFFDENQTRRISGGIDVGALKQPFETGFGKDHFAQHYPYSNIYLSAKLNTYFGLEGGYEHIYRQSKNAFYPALNGETLPVLGFSNPLNTDPVLYLSDAFSKGWHLNLVGYWSLCPNKTDLSASVGLTWIKMYFETLAISDPTVATPVVRFASAHKALARATLGISQMITPYFGGRLQLLWENTAKLSASTVVPIPLGAVNPTLSQDNYTVKPQNSYGADIGFFFVFG